MIDIHSHILPGIDDGPRTWDASIALCGAIAEEGIITSIATPHLIDGVYNNVLSRVAPLVAELNERLASASIPLKVLTGAEIDFSSRFVTERTDDLPTLGGGPAVLLEMPVAVIPPVIMETIFGLRARGLTPVIAHPERNELLQDNPALVAPWIKAGALLQLDGDSLLGVWGGHTKRCGEELLRRGLFHAMATDAHSTDKRPPRMKAALERAFELVGSGASALVTTGPELLLAGKTVPTPLYEVDAQPAERGDTPRRRSGGFFNRLLGRLGDQV